MRVLILLQGVPGSGKSTFVKQMGFEPITISTDDLRLLHGSPVMSEDGSYSIDQKLPEYSYWKYMRTVKENMYKNPMYTMFSDDGRTNEFVSFLHGLPHENLKLDIITLRKAFYKKLRDGRNTAT